MRLDKFLKVSALAKRRSIAKEALDAGRIECAGRPLKPSYQVKIGDELLIRYATRDVRVRIEAVPEKPGVRVPRASLYTTISDSKTVSA
ncbi:MAG: RNA-binding S4 domain-containing protein [Candidatus Eremiobacteraeota bacterium]|nr:RNA-binding S4 domain-containing protein [Candidatus Eremiobacteraeota bacterium]MBC5826392.1 RNA-binding S4 domain-containing protein [Candidatus Eremiobacteraeota bacterium]